MSGDLNWIVQSNGIPVFDSIASLQTYSGIRISGMLAWVADQNEYYQLDTANTFVISSPLIIAASGGGNWFRRNKKYVVGNFTLWACPLGGHFGGGDSKIGGFTPGQIAASNANVPNIILDLVADFPVATTTITSALVDLLGNLWVTGFSSNALTAAVIKKYKLSDILSSGTPTPSVSIVLTPPASVSNTTTAFDKQNNLWILYGKGGTFGVATLQKFNQSTYQNSGSPTPDITITLFNPGAVLPATANTEGIAFDAEGNLWVGVGATNGATQGGMLMFTQAQLNVTNTAILPSVFWSGSNFPGGGGNNAVSGICFGPTGLLWVASYSGNKISAYDPRSPSSGNPAPLIVLTSTTFNGPIWVCFDTAGNLWACNDNNSLIYRIPAASLAASGAVVPDVILSQATILAFPAEITFPNNPNRSGFLTSGVPITP